MTNADAELLKDVVTAEVGEINLCASVIGIRELELILLALKFRTDGTLTIKNVSGVLSMLELGAYLNAMVTEEKK